VVIVIHNGILFIDIYLSVFLVILSGVTQDSGSHAGMPVSAPDCLLCKFKEILDVINQSTHIIANKKINQDTGRTCVFDIPVTAIHVPVHIFRG
jgi:hypothetical protein